MSEQSKHIPDIQAVKETTTLKQSLRSLQQSLAIHPILAFLEGFDSFFKKKKRALVNNEVLFTP